VISKKKELKQELAGEEREILEEEKKLTPEELRKKRRQEIEDEIRREQAGW
jgi:hypothetical protein